MVNLFATLLRKDDDGIHYLVTPGEKVTVTVADAPFVATRVDRHGTGKSQTLVFTTNVGDLAAAGPDHPLRINYDPETKQPRPYVLIRGRLEARILRAPFYEMCNAAESEGGVFGVWSNGVFFPLEPPM